MSLCCFVSLKVPKTTLYRWNIWILCIIKLVDSDKSFKMYGFTPIPNKRMRESDR